MNTSIAEVERMSQNPFAPNPNLQVWVGTELVDVQDAKISVFDHGLLYGDGIFEGIRIYDGKIFKEAEHIRRAFESAKAIRLEIPMTPAQVSEAMHQAMDANDITGDGYIRLIVTRGARILVRCQPVASRSPAHTTLPPIDSMARIS